MPEVWFTADFHLGHENIIRYCDRPFETISEMDADIAAPDVNFALNDANFYDGTTAFAFGIERGALIRVHERVDVNVNLGFRYTGGLSDIDPLVGSGLEDINDDTGRWTLPLMVGIRVKF